MDDTIISNLQMKKCRKCGEIKSLNDYYIQSSNGKHDGICKLCHRMRNKTYAKKRKIDASQAHEQVCMDYMQGLGIYTVPGKLSEYTYVDLVSWGFIRVEVKLAEGRPGHAGTTNWMFRFSVAQVNRRLLADVLVLIIPHETWQYYIFDAKNPVFYRNGKLKTGVPYLEDGSRRKDRIGANPLTPEMMNAARDDWTILLDKMPDLRAIRSRVVETAIQNMNVKPVQKVLI